tara:strand:+ start:1614 stop:2564 length:951 start_codon:yes stop_codon:yes gene_type:complete
MLYKEGSKDREINILIQETVGAKPDGHFGKKTTNLVIIWQKKNNLMPDGVVGPKTLALMGILDTDNSKQASIEDHTFIVENGLEITKAFMPKGEYMKGPTNKDYVFIHHTAGWENPFKTIRHWAKDKRGAVATEFVLGGQKITTQNANYDGQVVQAFPEGGYGWHLGVGRRKIHTESVGIEVNNFGQLTKGGYKKNKEWVAGKANKFYTYVGTQAHPDQVFELEKEFRGYKYWHNYTDNQIDNLYELIVYIAMRDNIDVSKGLPEMIRKEGAFKAFDFCDTNYCEKHPGLWAHTNVRKGKVDMYPHPKLVKMLLDL